MPTVQFYNYMGSRFTNQSIQAGSLERPVSVTVAGSKYEVEYEIANGANTLMYNNQLTSFNTLYLVSDFNTRAQFGDTGNAAFSIGLRGTGNTEKFGVALTLGSDSTTSGNTINTIRVFNVSGSTATVRLIATK
jgi:hypothetical protein